MFDISHLSSVGGADDRAENQFEIRWPKALASGS
jgi:hypothetical protein